MSSRVAFILKGYPRLSESFIAQEILALERRDLDILIVSLRRPTDRARHPIHAEIKAPVHYLPEYLRQQPARVWRAWREARDLPRYREAHAAWWRDLRRDPTPNRVRRFGQALVLARELPRDVSHLHAHFLHTPASVARYTSLLTGRPWSCSAHAKDVWTTPEWEISDKLASAQWLAACSAVNAARLRPLGPPGAVELIYHGLDFTRFPPPAEARPSRDGSDESDPVAILSVGRAVDKKGHDALLDALAQLPSTLQWRLEHVGGGPLLGKLKRRATAAGIANRITWFGPQPQNVVLERYRAADLFVLASRIAPDGDRDGLPNVLMEAQSQGLACLATRVSAIPELIEDGVTGTLVPPGDGAALGAALAALLADPERRRRLGEAGLRRTRARFRMARGIDRLAHKFGLDPPAAAVA